jgi:glycosyltransferase involved in cell wall biosynthesis
VRAERPLRVGLNLAYLTESAGGSGTIARELIPALLRVEPGTRLTAFFPRTPPSWAIDADWAGEVECVRLPGEHGRSSRHGALALASQVAGIPPLARRRRLDVVHGLANLIPPVCPGVATVVTVLDLIWIRFPRTMEARATIGMRVLTRVSARRARRVLVLSRAVAEDVAAAYGVSPERIDVTPLGVRVGTVAPDVSERVRERLGLGRRRVVLCPAQKREHKNLLALVRAVARIDDPGVCLVIPGTPTAHEEALRDEGHRLGIGDRVVLPGWVSDEEIEALFRIARCLVLPSFDEGFGLPVLEAMARDVPVACSDIAATREVAGDAALRFDPRDVDAMAAAIRTLLEDDGATAELRRRGRERARQFTWERTARATLDAYHRAAAVASDP